MTLYGRAKVGCITSVEVRFWLEESAVVQILVTTVYQHFELSQKPLLKYFEWFILILKVHQKPPLKDLVNGLRSHQKLQGATEV